MNFKGSGWSRSTHSLEGVITKAAIHPHVDLSDCWSPIVPILVDSEPRVEPVDNQDSRGPQITRHVANALLERAIRPSHVDLVGHDLPARSISIKTPPELPRA